MSIEVNATEQIIEVNATGSTIDINVSSQTVDVNATTSVIEVTASYNPGINLPNGGTTGQVLKKQSNTDYDTYWATDEKGVPYTGATGDVDLGEYELKAGQIEFDQSPTGTAGVAVTRWNDTIGSTETTLKGGNVILKNGVDLVARVVNKVTPNTTLTKAAYQAVKISGAQGQRLAVALAQADNDNNSADTIGLVTETIATNQEGFIMTVGNLEGINTTGSLQGETWADGDVLYLSPTTPGALTNVKPNGSTGHIVVVGYVEYAHANNGKIYVKIMNGWELDELHNVYITSPANSEVLTYESATSLWKNKTIATALGYTPVPSTRTLTINGTAYDLSADRSWTINSNPAGSNTQIQYNNSGVFGASAGLTYDDSTGLMTLRKDQNAFTDFLIQNNSNTANALSRLRLRNNSGREGQFAATSASATPYGIISADSFGLYGNCLNGMFLYSEVNNIRFSAGSSTAQMTITNAGRLLLGTTTESTYLLDVNGTARVSGDVMIGSGSQSGYKVRVVGGIFADASCRFGSTQIDNGFTSTGGSTFVGSQQTIRDGSALLVGGVAGNSTIDASAIVEIRNTTKGFLQPRMTTTQRDAIASPAIGLSIYNTTTNTNDFYNGTSWVSQAAGNIYTADGTLTGNRTVTMGGNSLSFTGGNFGVSLPVIGANSYLQITSASTSFKSYFGTSSSNQIAWLTNIKYNGTAFVRDDNTKGAWRIAKVCTSSDSTSSIFFDYWNTSGSSIGSFLSIFGSGNVSIGGYSDPGVKFYVPGDMKINANFYISQAQDAQFWLSSTYGTKIGTATNQKLSFWNAVPIVQPTNNVAINDVLSNTGLRAIGGISNFTTDVYVGSSTINSSATLQADSTTKGFLPPRMTAAQKTAISTPATGLVIYQTDSTEGLYQYKSTGWEAIGGGGTSIYNSDGTLTGNRTVTLSTNTLTFAGSYITVSDNANSGTYLKISNTTSGTAAQAYTQFESDATAGFLNIGKRSNTFTQVGIINSADSFIENTTKGDISIRNAFSSGKIKLATGSATTSTASVVGSTFIVGGDVSGSGYIMEFATSANAPRIDFIVNSVYTGQVSSTGSAINIKNNVNNSGVINFNTTVSSVDDTRFRIFNNGNVLIQNGGTFTDAGYKLDVQGTGRYAGTYTSTAGLKINNFNIQPLSATNQVLGFNTFYNGSNFVYDATGSAGYIQYFSNEFKFVTTTSGTSGTTLSSPITIATLNDTSVSFNGTLSAANGGHTLTTNNVTLRFGSAVGDTTRNLRINYFSGGFSHWIVPVMENLNSDNNNISFYLNNSTTSGGSSAPATGNTLAFRVGALTNTSYKPLLIEETSTLNTFPNASSILNLNSTSKGFLPPRMTETQKNAISTPAIGLVIYQTDGTEGLYQYKSTGWSQVAGTGGGGGISRSVNVISTNTTAGASASTDYVYLISGTTTLTLPTAVGNTNRYTLKNVGTNTVTINTTSSQTIDGSTSITMAVRYTALDVISDGTNWNII